MLAQQCSENPKYDPKNYGLQGGYVSYPVTYALGGKTASIADWLLGYYVSHLS